MITREARVMVISMPKKLKSINKTILKTNIMKTSNVDYRLELSNRFQNALETCGMTVNKNWFFNIHEASIECILTKDDSTERVFGSNIDLLYYEQYSGNDRKLQLNTGTMGSFDLSCTASVEKHILITEFIKNFPVVEALTKQFCQSVVNFNKNNQ